MSAESKKYALKEKKSNKIFTLTKNSYTFVGSYEYIQNLYLDCCNMTENDRRIMADFEAKLHRLVYEYNQKEEAVQELSRMLEEKENTLKELQMRCQALEKSYNDLKQARIISLSSEGIDATKERISRLVREIDRCIESLKK